MISLDRQDRAGDVRDVRGGDEPHAPVEQVLVELAEIDAALVADLEVAQLRAGLLAQQLPGNDVRVVLELGQDDRVALAHVAPAP